MIKFKPTEKQFQIGLWLVGVAVVVLAVYVWYRQRIEGAASLSGYAFFPVLGLSAFSLMWTLYVSDALRNYFNIDYAAVQRYFSVTSWLVLILILLHPGILWFLLFRDGLGLPPMSYLSLYTDLVGRTALLLGTVSLGAFLAFELRRKFAARSWWKYIEYANIAAMFAIFIHALALGVELHVTWYRILWFGYGLTLALAISYSYRHKHMGGSHEK